MLPLIVLFVVVLFPPLFKLYETVPAFAVTNVLKSYVCPGHFVSGLLTVNLQSAFVAVAVAVEECMK